MAKMSESLQPLVLAQVSTTLQVSTTNVSVTVVPAKPDLETMLLVAGLGLLVGLLIASGGLGE
jgi:hypothetical protein